LYRYAEYFAYEIAKSLGVDAPATRLIRKLAASVAGAGTGLENTPPEGAGQEVGLYKLHAVDPSTP
jgi:hypothetical protein